MIVIGILVGGCSQQREKVTLGVESSLLPASVWVAENKGYFEDEGLDLTIKEFDSGKASFLAMLEGEGADISTVAPCYFTVVRSKKLLMINNVSYLQAP